MCKQILNMYDKFLVIICKFMQIRNKNNSNFKKIIMYIIKIYKSTFINCKRHSIGRKIFIIQVFASSSIVLIFDMQMNYVLRQSNADMTMTVKLQDQNKKVVYLAGFIIFFPYFKVY